MDDQLLELLENLKEQKIVDVVTGDIEGENSFSQVAIFRLENGKQFSLQSHTLERHGDQVEAMETGYSGLTGSYDDLDDFWDDVEGED